jgi:2-octaprenylphenol hydroxylase (EC 1.14.13.-)
MSISDAFAEFDAEPLASASVAQVHTAVLHSGESVVVKVLRPDIEGRIRSDIGLLYELARFAERFWADARRLRPMDVVAEFERTTLDELDLVREAANAAKLRRNFENSDVIYIPEIHWPLTRRKVLVMERIHGIPVGNIDQLREGGADFKLLAERGVEIFFTQVFRDNFFHADMHPGNIFVDLPAKYIAVDFGIVGTLSLSDQHYLAENFLAFFNRDYRKVAEMHVESGWVSESTRIEEFESAIRSVCEPIFEKPLKDISFGQLLLRLFQTARRFDMHVQPQLVLLQKTLLNIEGLGTTALP